jgi:hypothetical protein
VKKGNRCVGAGDLVVELLPDDALGLPAEAVAVEGNRSVEVVYRQSDEADLRSHCHLLPGLAGRWSGGRRGR